MNWIMPAVDQGPPRRLGNGGRGVPSHVVSMGVLMLVITALHLYTDPSLQVLHLLYRRLYYVPILYAAFVFGLRGGLLTGFGSALLLVPTAMQDFATLGVADSINEMAMYLIIGGLFGWMREVEDRQNAEYRQVSTQLQAAYGKLEERAVEVLTIQEYTNSILHSITAGVLTIGPDGSLTTANPAAERLFGVSESDMVPHTLSVVVADDGGLHREVAKVLDGRLPRLLRDLTIKTRDGRELHAQAAVSRMQDLNGRILGAVVTLEDVSEVRALTDQLIRADRLAALGELTAGVAHEVRNPLGIIRATVQLLDEQDYEESRAREAGEVIVQEVDRLDRVIKALLDFGRPWSPALIDTDLNSLVDEVVLFTQKWANRSDVEIDVIHGEDLPTTYADPHQMKQVFVNLISNAVQSMEGGGTITIETSADDGFVAVRFTDDGPGMDPESAKKVFDPFYSTREEGTGLGLTIVHRIVDEHDGVIELSSAPGRGTTFIVRLPAHGEIVHWGSSSDDARTGSEG